MYNHFILLYCYLLVVDYLFVIERIGRKSQQENRHFDRVRIRIIPPYFDLNE